MARCGCDNACSCYFAQDDILLYSPPFPTTQGRYNSTVSGSGTTADPYVVEFLDSEEFRPRTGEIIRIGNINTLDATATVMVFNPWTQVVYSSPDPYFFVGFPNAISGNYVAVPENRFWFFSAQCEFVHNGNSAGIRKLMVGYNNGQFGVEKIVASKTTTGLSEDIWMNASGYLPVTQPGVNLNGTFELIFFQNSGANMTIRNVSFSIVGL